MTKIFLPQDHPSMLPFIHDDGYGFTETTGLVSSGVDAVFTPSIQGPQARFPLRTSDIRRELPKDWMPVDFDFRNPKSRLYYLPTVLYSAGVAYSDNPHCIFTQHKDQKSRFVVADSGGFQLISGTFPLAGKEDGPRRIQEWQRAIGANVAMPIDLPTAMIGMKEHPRINTLRDCLEPSVTYLKKFLACDTDLPLCIILHGDTRADQDTWYQAMRHFMPERPERLQGWAFPSKGSYGCHWGNVLHRICQIIQDGLIGNNPNTGVCARYIHFLGTGTPKTAAILSILSEQLNHYLLRQGLLDKPKIPVDAKRPQSVVVSYDTSTPYTMATRRFEYISSPELDLMNMSIKIKRLPTKKEDGFVGSTKLAAELSFSPIGAGLKWGDIIVKRDDDRQQRDMISELIVSAHNTYSLFCLMERAKELVNFKRPIAAHHVPRELLDTVDIIYEIFDHDDPMMIFEKHDKHLGVIK